MTHDQTMQHPLDEMCFHCADDMEILRAIRYMDEGKPWDGRTIHWQVPENFCPYLNETNSEEQ
ncbi:MAG: hypothetical protein QJR12_16780 [Mycobacterium sp.]|uniref:hypothetical protein n=1 Tax=Mycobacterium sp. TaxID=1785 RepID=UPI0026133A2D|nr:hypothetical protein [Mycobacterium sp.]MDI3315862.1 hypothetical protein [Mycobacterium sp.]